MISELLRSSTRRECWIACAASWQWLQAGCDMASKDGELWPALPSTPGAVRSGNIYHLHLCGVSQVGLGTMLRQIQTAMTRRPAEVATSWSRCLLPLAAVCSSLGWWFVTCVQKLQALLMHMMLTERCSAGDKWWRISHVCNGPVNISWCSLLWPSSG